MSYTWIATAAFGLEGVVKRELLALGFAGVKAELGGVRFTAEPQDAFRANLWLRCADRVLLLVGEGEARSFDALFELARALPWEEYLPRDAAFPVSGRCARSQLMSVRDCQAIVKKAIVERLKGKYGGGWFAETGAVHAVEAAIHCDIARLTIDASGAALNRRGYRTWNGEAPLRETLAAALVKLSPWRPGQPLHDPCCGTGTLLIEAAMIASDRAPGLTRAFAMESFGFVDARACAALREEAMARFQPERIADISGTDIDEGALALCKRHVEQAGLRGRIAASPCDLRDLALSREGVVFLANPPYGERMSERKTCEMLYRHLGKLQARHAGSALCVLSSHAGLERCVGRRAVKKRRLYNGRLECEFAIFGKRP